MLLGMLTTEHEAYSSSLVINSGLLALTQTLLRLLSGLFNHICFHHFHLDNWIELIELCRI